MCAKGKNMTKNTEISLKDKMIAALLKLASERSWDFVDFADIADEAGVAINDAHEYFDDRSDILAAYGRRLDRKMLENCVMDDDMSCREKIFDLLMERFDIVNEDRESILSILHGFKGDPKEAVLSFPHLGKSMCRTLDAAGIETNGIFGAVKVAGLTGIYLYTLKTWKEDESPDMARTMATLDKALDKAEMLWNTLPIKK